MTSYTNSFRLTLQDYNANPNTWGTVVNGLLTIIDSAGAGVTNLDVTGSVTIDMTTSATDGSDSLSKRAILKFTGLPTADTSVKVPAVSKIYIVDSSLQAATKTVFIHPTGSNVGVTISASDKALIYCDGTDMFLLTRYVDFSQFITSASASVLVSTVGSVRDWISSTSVSSMLVAQGYMTSNATSVMVSTIGSVRDWISSASVSALVSTIVNNTTNALTQVGGWAVVSINAGAAFETLVATGNIASVSFHSSPNNYVFTFVSAYSSAYGYVPTGTAYNGGTAPYIVTASVAGCILNLTSNNARYGIVLVPGV